MTNSGYLTRGSILISVLATMLAVGLGPSKAVSQNGIQALGRGESLSDSLVVHGLKAYVVKLGPRQFIYGEADQLTVDVVVKVVSPGGRDLGTFDGPARGPEPFQFTSDSAGMYRIEVRPFEETTGRFSIRLITLEDIARTPDARVDQIMARYSMPGSPGGVIAVLKNDKVIFEKGYGLADLEYDVPNTPTTPYHMASVSKQFTAFAIMMLKEEGKLSLSDDIRKYLPELHDFGEKITIRHLLTHTSGLRDQWNLWVMSGHLMDDVIREQDLLTLMVNQRELNFKPGDELLYCNSGYMLLSEIVQRVSGEPFGKWMKENVFLPLGMTHTQIYDDHRRIVQGRAYSYQNRDGETEKAVLSYANRGATSLFSTAEDLVKWLENWKTGRVGGPRLLEQMQTKTVLNGGDTVNYGFGISVEIWRGQYRISHSGGDAGYRTYVAYFPGLDAGIVTLGNTASFNAVKTAGDVMDAFFGDLLSPVHATMEPTGAPLQEKDSLWVPSLKELRALAGRYYSPELETFYTVSVKDSHLVVYQRRLGEIPLKPGRKPNEFLKGEFPLQEVRFIPGGSDEQTQMRVSNGRVRNLLFRRVPE